MRRRLTLLVVALVAALLGAGVLAPAPALAEGGSKPVTFGLGAAEATNIDGRPYYYYAAAGGATLTDHVAVLNYSNQPLPLRVYATDGYNTPTGTLDLLPIDRKPQDIGSWIQLRSNGSLITVPGRTGNGPPGKVLLPFTVTVPKGAAPGDHVGGLVAALRTVGRNKQGFQVDLDQRVGLQVYLRVAGALHPRLAVEHLTASYSGTLNPLGTGTVTFHYTLHNTGNVRLGGRLDTQAKALLGSWHVPTQKDIPSLVPGGTADVTAKVSGVWPEVLLRGKVHVTPLTLSTDVNPATSPATAAVWFWAVPWTLIALVVLLLATWWSARRWSRRRAAGGGDGGGTSVPAQTSPAPTGPPVAPEPEPARSWTATRRALVVVVGALAAVTLAPSAAHAEGSVPFKDLQTRGGIALCSDKGEVVSSGSINDRPFVAKAVASDLPPASWQPSGTAEVGAMLYAYQPRKDAYPDRWNGDTLTSSTAYQGHPTAIGTELDFSLADYLKEFPLMWDDLVQLRLFWGKTGVGYDNSEYASLVLKVTGTRWEVVDGLSQTCDKGKGQSTEVTIAGLDPKATAAALARASQHPGSSAIAQPTATAGTSPAPGTSAAPAPRADGATSTSAGGWGRGFALTALGLAVLGAAVTAVRMVRSRRAFSD